MQIRSVPFHDVKSNPAHPVTQVVMLEVSGQVVVSDQVVQRARQLIEQTGSVGMLDSFDWAIRNQSLASAHSGSGQ